LGVLVLNAFFYQPEEMDKWSPSFLTGDPEKAHTVPGRIISCFNASAALCMSFSPPLLPCHPMLIDCSSWDIKQDSTSHLCRTCSPKPPHRIRRPRGSPRQMVYRTTTTPSVRAGVDETTYSTPAYSYSTHAVLVCCVVAPSSFVSLFFYFCFGKGG
jgi:hypothetical protein